MNEELKKFLERHGFEKVLDAVDCETYFKAIKAPLGIAVQVSKGLGWSVMDNELFDEDSGVNLRDFKQYLNNRTVLAG